MPMTRTAAAVAALLFVLCGCNPQNAPVSDRPVELPDKAYRLAREVFEAGGGQRYYQVARMRFTCNVEEDGKVVSKTHHDWQARKGIDTVTWDDKTVTVDLNNPGDSEDAQAAYQRWLGDSYWLLAPFKLREPGVKLKYVGREEIGSVPMEVVQVTFDKGPGLTPGDEYIIYIDPKSFRVRRWDYTPKDGAKQSATWEAYARFNGLLLSQQHVMGKKRIYFTDIEVYTLGDAIYQ
jgi:hypothetical protein